MEANRRGDEGQRSRAGRLCLLVGDKLAHPDRKIARIASRQHGVITIAQLGVAGIGRKGASARVRAGRLHRVHRGVYAVGHRRLGNEGRWMAAVLACGEGASLSHRSAAALWGFGAVTSAPVDVSVPGRAGRARRTGINLHRPASLTPADVTARRGIPVTKPSRTLDDLRRIAPPAELRRAIREAEALGFDTGGRDLDPTRSELEHRFLRLCRRHRIPPPRVNVAVDAFVVDFLWPDSRLIVEVDGYRFHGGREAFEADRARDTRLKLLGYDVLRFTWRQLSEQPTAVARALGTLLP